jgi:hypothetical protein
VGWQAVVLDRWQGAGSPDVSFTLHCGLELELLDEWPYSRPHLGRLATYHDSFERGRRLTWTTSFPRCREKSKRRSFTRWHSTNCKTKPKPPVDAAQPKQTEPSRTCQSGPNTPQGLRLTQTKEPGVFFLSWHRGTVASTREWNWLFCCASCT